MIKEAYGKLNTNRLDDFVNKKFHSISPNKIIFEDEFIELRLNGNGSVFSAVLVYHIELEELFIVKRPNILSTEIPKLIQREIDNYSKIRHPFMPKFIGKGENNKYIVIEFINGKTLLNINDKFSFDEKITIIFEIMIIVEFLHRNHFIFRDLSPGNIMIDAQKTVV